MEIIWYADQYLLKWNLHENKLKALVYIIVVDAKSTK